MTVMENADRFVIKDEFRGQEARTLTQNVLVDMWAHYSVVHVNDSGKVILAIGYNPKNRKNNGEKIPEVNDKDPKKRKTPLMMPEFGPSDLNKDGALEATRRNGIYRFSQLKDNDAFYFKVGTYIQTDLFIDPSPTADELGKEKALLPEDLKFLKNLITQTRPDAILIDWGSAGTSTLRDDERNEPYKKQLITILENSKLTLFSFGDKFHAASQLSNDVLLKPLSVDQLKTLLTK